MHPYINSYICISQLYIHFNFICISIICIYISNIYKIYIYGGRLNGLNMEVERSQMQVVDFWLEQLLSFSKISNSMGVAAMRRNPESGFGQV